MGGGGNTMNSDNSSLTESFMVICILWTAQT